MNEADTRGPSLQVLVFDPPRAAGAVTAGPARAWWRRLAASNGIWLGLFMAVFGAILLVAAVQAAQARREARASGIPARATVVEKSARGQGDAEVAYLLRVAFRDRDGVPRESIESVDVVTYGALREGGALDIRYAPSDPTLTVPAGSMPASGPLATVLPLLAASIALGLGCYVLARAARATRQPAPVETGNACANNPRREKVRVIPGV